MVRPSGIGALSHAGYNTFMAEVIVRDLRNHGGEVLHRVARGEVITISRDGRQVAELSPSWGQNSRRKPS